MSEMKQNAFGTAWAKTILLGEHAVVHGGTAVAMSLDITVRVNAIRKEGPLSLLFTDSNHRVVAGDGSPSEKAISALVEALSLRPEGFHLEVVCNFPNRAGLGSSAAIAAAVARALVVLQGLSCSDADLFRAVQASEKVFHGNPSGIDATVALHGGILTYSKSRGMIPVDAIPPEVLIVYSGDPGDTSTTVERFAHQLQREPEESKFRLEAIETIVEKGIAALISGDLKTLGQAMYENHRHLAWFRVSSLSLDRIVEIAGEADALGAKLTGGGGGGCAVILKPERPEQLVQKLNAAGFRVVVS